MTQRSVDAADAPVAVREIVAPPAWRAIDFISDLHLADDTPRAFDTWATYLRGTPAEAVFILGDLFEAWPGDDARVEGFEARCAEVLREAAAHRFVAFMAGNRDFLVGLELLRETGVEPLDDPTVLKAFGGRALLSHGDAWCLDDLAYQRFRIQVRSVGWKSAVLAQTLPQRRALALQLRQQSEQQSAGRSAEDWADVDRPLALRWLEANAADTLIHGHTHRPATEALAPDRLRHVLSDWDMDHGSARRAEVLRWQNGGFSRLTPMDAAQPLAAARA